MISIKYTIKMYSCNYKKNTKCKKINCCNCNGPCSHTTEWKFAKKTPLNYIKRIINITKVIKNNCSQKQNAPL